ncbi:MAG: energy-coupling factor ABC transporter permease, partial [Butyricicoccus pullicaecorum]|nr:energy-coupling factor ABC transporter permease [Butyricicoccus pullicaecorum]
MTKNEKRLLALSAVLSAALCVPTAASAMHIMEGYLPPVHCIVWAAVCIPFLVSGLLAIRRTLNAERRTLILLAMSGAFIFVISSLKIPSVSGSCSHMTGTGLSAILFGPAITSILGIIVLLFQAILLAHGGLTSLGANTFSMAVAGPLLSWGIWKLSRKMGLNKKASVFFAAFLGDLF